MATSAHDHLYLLDLCGKLTFYGRRRIPIHIESLWWMFEGPWPIGAEVTLCPLCSHLSPRIGIREYVRSRFGKCIQRPGWFYRVFVHKKHRMWILHFISLFERADLHMWHGPHTTAIKYNTHTCSAAYLVHQNKTSFFFRLFGHTMVIKKWCVLLQIRISAYKRDIDLRAEQKMEVRTFTPKPAEKKHFWKCA